MNLRWETFESPDGGSYRQIAVLTEPDLALFARIANLLQKELGGGWATKLSEFDTRYWDLVVGKGRITVHLEHYLGITVYATDGAAAGIESQELLDSAYRVLSTK